MKFEILFNIHQSNEYSMSKILILKKHILGLIVLFNLNNLILN